MSGWEHYFSVPTSFEHEGEVSMKKNRFCVLIFAVTGVSAALWIWNTFLKKEN